jgi:hypothetical protein
MNSRGKRGYQPGVEKVEERCAATAHLVSAALALHAAAARRHLAHARPAEVPRGHHVHWPAASKGTHSIASPIVTTPAAPSLPTAMSLPPGTGGGGITVHFRLPYNFKDWAVVTLWNNTSNTVSFTVSASTFQNGQYFPFTFQSGQSGSFFAPVVVPGQAPLFQVSFSPGSANPIPLSNENIVFESNSYVPSSTAGWPYAINFGVNGYSLSSI